VPDAVFKPKPAEIAGLDLVMFIGDDGVRRLGDGARGREMHRFPEQVEVCGMVYTLENVKRNCSEHPALEAGCHRCLDWGQYA